MDYYSSSADTLFFAFIGIFIVFAIIFGIITYILTAVGLYGMAKSRNFENPWLAFIPVANLYIMGKLIGELKIGSYKVPSPELVLPISTIVPAILNIIPLIGPLVSLAVIVLHYIALYALFKKYRGEKATVMIIVSIITLFFALGLGEAIYIFNLRNSVPLDEGTSGEIVL